MKEEKEKILLLMLPYWTPLIPPMGISCLKSFLQAHGYPVRSDDANVFEAFKRIYNRYFEILKRAVPAARRGNFYSIGHDVLQNHMMAYINRERAGEQEYCQLVKELVFKTFYCPVDDRVVAALDDTVGDFFNRLEDYILDLLAEEQPSLLGISVYSGSLPASIYAFKVTRRDYPRIETVMGGGIFCDHLALGTENFDILLEETKDFIDKIVVGEGELLLLKFLRGELPPSRRVFSAKEIADQVLPLSAAPAPDFSDFDLAHYPFLSAYGSRSCPYQCNFCSDSVMWGRYRKKAPKQVAAEFAALYEKYGYQLFMMSDLLLNPIISELARELADSKTAIYWDGCLRADGSLCDIENTQLWRRGGFYKARLGLESGSARILAEMGKGVTVEDIKRGVANLAFAGIQTTTLWIVGYPGETEADFLETLALVEELKDDIYEAECRPFYYYKRGQAGSHLWQAQGRDTPLYVQEAEKLLLFQTWILDGLPSREESYARVGRFSEHCARLGIPNIYSLHDLYKADERWKSLHKNAVPALLEFKKRGVCIDECKRIEEVHMIRDTALQESGDFEF